MAWNISGELIETCSCNMLCPCWFGQADLMLMDQGYCGTSLLLRIREGAYDSVDLSGQNAIISLHFPGPTLFDANGTVTHRFSRAGYVRRPPLDAVLVELRKK